MASKRERMSDVDLKALVAREISLAQSDRSAASTKQTRALEYYQGIMKDVPSEVGRSKAVSRDLADTMGWVLPGIMRVYTASEHMAVAEPVGPEDEAGAKQATDGLNYVFWKENDGYRIVYNATWDSLISGNGVVKCWHDDTPKTTVSFHSGLSDDDLTMLLGGEDSDDIEVLEYSGPYGKDASVGDGTHSVKIKRTTKYGCTKVEAIPPEDYGKDGDSRTCDEARFQYHRSSKTRSELIKMGFDRKMVEALGKASDNKTSEEIARQEQATDEGDPSTDLVDLYECYIRVDRDDDGIAEMWQVFYGGTKDGGEILDSMEWEDESPFDDIPCSPMPHKWEAGSLADETIDVMQIKTVMLRQALDNTYATNNPQRFVTGKITNPEELFSPSFGGAIFGENGSTITPLVIPFVAQHAYDAINYQDQVIERRTGVSRSSMALDPDALQNQTATANQNAKDAAYSQIELIARNQAELGWKKVFRKILKLEVKHQDKERTIRMGGKPVKIDPRVWNTDMDISINVGLGTGSRDRDMAMLQMVLNQQLMLIDRLSLVDPEMALEMLPYVHTTLMKSAEAAGIRSPELFYPDFGREQIDALKQKIQERAQQPDPKIALEQEKLKADMQRGAAEMQMDGQKAQQDAEMAKQKLESDIVLQREKMQAELMLKREQLAAEMQLKTQQLAAELELKARLAEQEMNMKREAGFYQADRHAEVQKYSADSKAASSGVHLGGAPG